MRVLGGCGDRVGVQGESQGAGRKETLWEGRKVFLFARKRVDGVTSLGGHHSRRLIGGGLARPAPDQMGVHGDAG